MKKKLSLVTLSKNELKDVRAGAIGEGCDQEKCPIRDVYCKYWCPEAHICTAPGDCELQMD